ncbi:MAG: hypothetical protein WCP96_21885 [Methylococcaceae bacterium]
MASFQIVQKLINPLNPNNSLAFPRPRKKQRRRGKTHHPDKHPRALELSTRGAKERAPPQ